MNAVQIVRLRMAFGLTPSLAALVAALAYGQGVQHD